MPVLLGLLGIIVAAAIWWFRLKQVGQAGSEILDAAGRAKGAIKRRHLRKKADNSVFTAIDDARTATVVICLGIATRHKDLSELAEARLHNKMRTLLGYDDTQEDVVFAKWAVAQAGSTKSMLKTLAPLLKARLSPNEAEECIGLITDIAKVNAPLSREQEADIAHLRSALGHDST